MAYFYPLHLVCLFYADRFLSNFLQICDFNSRMLRDWYFIIELLVVYIFTCFVRLK